MNLYIDKLIQSNSSLYKYIFRQVYIKKYKIIYNYIELSCSGACSWNTLLYLSLSYLIIESKFKTWTWLVF